MAPHDVARGINLCNACETRPHRATRRKTGYVFELLDHAVPAHFNLTGSQRAWADEAHVPAEDVPQLRQLVHRRCAQDTSDARNSRIVLPRLDWARKRLGVNDHRSKFQRVEAPAGMAYALPRKQYRPAVFA